MLTTKQIEWMRRQQNRGKEFYYVGYYIDIAGHFILKPGTTSDLLRRYKEHNRDYPKSAHNPMKSGTTFEYLWFIPLSKYTTLRIEDRMKEIFKEQNFGEYQNNDRFVFDIPPAQVEIKVRKTYTIPIYAI